MFAGLVWIGVGVMLLMLAFSWLSRTYSPDVFLFSGIGTVFALLIHHFGFLRIVNSNLKRILSMTGKRCLFSFFPFKSYFLIGIMVAMGMMLRHSAVPKRYLAILYIAIGLALLLSSIRYIRCFVKTGRGGQMQGDGRRPSANGP